MTDKELIQALRYCAYGNCNDCCWWDSAECNREVTYLNSADRLEALLAENEHFREVTKMMPKWVSVEERLPETEGDFLVTVDEEIGNKEYIGGYLMAEYVPDCGWILEEYPQLENPNITYWQPLPEPPSTEGVER